MKGILGSLLASPAKSEAKMSSADLARLIARGTMSRSGERISWDRALQVMTLLACARVLAEGVSQVPWKLHQGDAGRIEVREHPVFELLYRQPNPWQTSFEWREQLMFHLVLGGNAFVHKLRVGSARRIASLEPFEPGWMRVERERDRRLRYFHRPEGGSETEVPADEVWHLRGPSWNGWLGLDITRLAREALGLSLATESAHADMHKGGARVSGIYTVQNQLTAEKFEQLAAWMDQYRAGGKREGETLLLDNGAKFEKTQMSGVDAEHLATRRYQVEEVCRATRVMPIMVGQADKTATYASAEQMFLAHVVHTLMPWYERLEQSADVNLLTREERAAGIYTKFNPNALMRGAAKDRGEFYAKALGAGGTPAWMTQDEVRKLEELEPRGGDADELSRG
ncbi:MAG: phage portal protein, partial [Erythrobacter sp.]|nr:phage portal protein [Erythrobacter sp.]